MPEIPSLCLIQGPRKTTMVWPVGRGGEAGGEREGDPERRGYGGGGGSVGPPSLIH